jgi:capsular polysaccharide biosynthesis protein
MLRLAGHGDAELIEWRDRDARIERLVVPAYPSPSPAVCAWLRERMRDPLLAPGPAGLVDQPGGGERILVSRGDSAKAKRRLVNERELEERLGELGFRSYVLGELPVAEQITLFAGAEAVVAPHGAGLTNLVYARRAAVVELFGRRLKPVYYRLARLLGHPYRYMLCEPAGGRDDLRANAEEVARVASETIERLYE